MVLSLPAATGQLSGSKVAGCDPDQSDRPVGEVCLVPGDEGEAETGRVEAEAGEGERGWEQDVGREREEETLLEVLMESLTETRCFRIKPDT